MDFSYLNSISDGDLDFVQQFVSTFESNTANIVSNMKTAFDNGSKDDLRKLAHQLKPSLQMLELETLQEFPKQLDISRKCKIKNQ